MREKQEEAQMTYKQVKICEIESEQMWVCEGEWGIAILTGLKFHATVKPRDWHQIDSSAASQKHLVLQGCQEWSMLCSAHHSIQAVKEAGALPS